MSRAVSAGKGVPCQGGVNNGSAMRAGMGLSFRPGLPAPDTFPSPSYLGQLSSQAPRPRTPFPAQLAWDSFRPRPPGPRHLPQPNLPRTAFVPGLPAPDTFRAQLA
jgi:hypothetical protein